MLIAMLTPQETLKSFICSVTQEQDVMLTVGLKTVDTHTMIDVDALLDSGATGLFINRKLVQNNGIAMRVLEHWKEVQRSPTMSYKVV